MARLRTLSRNDQQTATVRHQIAIIGGGFSGTILAVQLLRQTKHPLALTVIDRSDSPGCGVAFAAGGPELVLNVPAAKMSAIHEDPDHFVRWLRTRMSWLSGGAFAPRWLYGEYLGELFREARSCNQTSITSWRIGEVISLNRGPRNAQLLLRDGSSVSTEYVVLATGTPPPNPLSCLERLGGHSAVRCSWTHDALVDIPTTGVVLLIGTGLTALDQVLALEQAGFRGGMIAISRKGRLPAVHGEMVCDWPADWMSQSPLGLIPLLRNIRRQIDSAQTRGVDWRAVIDSLRSHTPALWAQLSDNDRRRFLRHLQSYWNTARHRMPQKTCAALEALKQAGRFQLIAGSILSADSVGKQVSVLIRQRGHTRNSSLTVDRIVNCSGPGSLVVSRAPLYCSLIERGIVREDPLGLGIETTPEGSVVEADGEPSTQVFALGSLLKASRWETTAVAEIRAQASALASILLQQGAAHGLE